MIYSLYAFFLAHSIQRLSLIRPSMIVLARCKNMLDPTCNALGMYFERSQIHPPTVKRLSLSRYHDSNQGTFSPWYSKLAVHVSWSWSLIPFILSLLQNVYFDGKLVSSIFLQASMYSYGYTPFRIIRRNFSSHSQDLLVWLKFFFNTSSSRSFVYFILHLSHPNDAM